MSPPAARFVLLPGGARPPAASHFGARAEDGAGDSGPDDRGRSPDAALARALIRGEGQAPYQAWQRFESVVRGSLQRLVGPGVDEDDLCQEVFLRFFARVHTLRDPAAVRSFLFAVCLRVSRKELRRRWLRRWLRLTDDGTLPERVSEGALARDREGGMEARDAVVRYYAILDAVGGQGRSLFVARYIEGLELMEVARLHGLSVSTTQRRLGRVAKRIQAMVRRDPLLAEIVGADGEAP
jgi:RNA polymerase sigma-70 factor (ECF subfamily)